MEPTGTMSNLEAEIRKHARDQFQRCVQEAFQHATTRIAMKHPGAVPYEGFIAQCVEQYGRHVETVEDAAISRVAARLAADANAASGAVAKCKGKRYTDECEDEI